MKSVKSITEPPDRAYCPDCKCVRIKRELICVPKDDQGHDRFIGCRICNNPVEKCAEHAREHAAEY